VHHDFCEQKASSQEAHSSMRTVVLPPLILASKLALLSKYESQLVALASAFGECWRSNERIGIECYQNALFK